MKRTLTRVSVGAAALALAAGTGAATYATFSDAPQSTVVREVTVTDGTTAVSNGTLTIGEVYGRAHASVVEITVTTATSSEPVAPGSGTSQAQGSGFVLRHERSRDHERPRRRRRAVRGGHVLERQDLRRDDRRDGCVHRSRRPEGGRAASLSCPWRSATPPCRGQGRPSSRWAGRSARELGDGQDVSALGRSMEGAGRVRGQRSRTDRRRDQPRQLWRPAAGPLRPTWSASTPRSPQRVRRHQRRRLHVPSNTVARSPRQLIAATAASREPTSVSRRIRSPRGTPPEFQVAKVRSSSPAEEAPSSRAATWCTSVDSKAGHRGPELQDTVDAERPSDAMVIH